MNVKYLRLAILHSIDEDKLVVRLEELGVEV